MSLFNLAVLTSGSGTNLQAVIDATENGSIPDTQVALVVSNREGVYGLERAKKHGIVSAVISGKETDKLFEVLKTHKIDGIVLAGYLSILPLEVVEAFAGKIINIHPALLPKFGGMGFYGIKVHRAVIEAGDKLSGATAHVVDGGIDTGPILVRGVVPVLESDTAESLQERVLEIEHVVLVKAVKALARGSVEELINKPLTLK